MATDVLQALAQTLANAAIPGIGHCFDTSDTDPTPDAVTARADGLMQIGFIDPYQLLYDTTQRGGKVPTFGMQGQETDESTILILVFIRPLQPTNVGTCQRLARPFARHLIHDTIRAHNTLGSAAWRARIQDAKAGELMWGGNPWYAVQATCIVAEDRSVLTAS